MTSKYEFARTDDDLILVLDRATKQELAALVRLLHTKGTCSLGKSCRYPPRIAHEFQLMGGNTLLNVARSHGVKYKEIAENVAEKVGAKIEGCMHVAEMEWRILVHMVASAEKKMSQEKAEDFRRELGRLLGEERRAPVAGRLDEFDAPGVLAAVTLAMSVHVPGRSFAAVAKDIGKGTAVAVLGGLIALGALGLINIAGPAYSVTVPGVVQIAAMRLTQGTEDAAVAIGGGQ